MDAFHIEDGDAQWASRPAPSTQLFSHPTPPDTKPAWMSFDVLRRLRTVWLRRATPVTPPTGMLFDLFDVDRNDGSTKCDAAHS